jgi:hypothetical protein
MIERHTLDPDNCSHDDGECTYMTTPPPVLGTGTDYPPCLLE